MARQATIIGQAVDIWGATWDVRETRPTQHGFDVQLGWPQAVARGRGGSGGPRVIITASLAAYLKSLRHRSPAILPLGMTAIKRLRRLLGLNVYLDSAAWWEERADDLADMTLARFAARHGVSVAAASLARTALLGRAQRPARWWREPSIARLILSNRPLADIADELDISVGSVSRLRSALREAQNPDPEGTDAIIIRGYRDQTPLVAIAAEAGLTYSQVAYRANQLGLKKRFRRKARTALIHTDSYAEIDAIITKGYSNGSHLDLIAAEAGLTFPQVQYRARHLGLIHPERKKRLPEEEREARDTKIVADYKAGVEVTTICDRYDLKHLTNVYHVLRRAGIPPDRRPKPGR